MNETSKGEIVEESWPLDISERVTTIINSDSKHKPVDLKRLLQEPEIKNAPSLTLTLDYTNLTNAGWVKAFLEKDTEQKRTAKIRATEDQMKEAANVFGSGVEWIKI